MPALLLTILVLVGTVIGYGVAMYAMYLVGFRRGQHDVWRREAAYWSDPGEDGTAK